VTLALPKIPDPALPGARDYRHVRHDSIPTGPVPTSDATPPDDQMTAMLTAAPPMTSGLVLMMNAASSASWAFAPPLRPDPVAEAKPLRAVGSHKHLCVSHVVLVTLSTRPWDRPGKDRDGTTMPTTGRHRHEVQHIGFGLRRGPPYAIVAYASPRLMRAGRPADRHDSR